MSDLPKWIRELNSYVDSIAYGEIEPKIKRVNNHTVEIEVSSIETIKYKDNPEALTGVIQLINNLVEANTSGLLTVVFAFKDGKIETVGYKNTKQTRY